MRSKMNSCPGSCDVAEVRPRTIKHDVIFAIPKIVCDLLAAARRRRDGLPAMAPVPQSRGVNTCSSSEPAQQTKPPRFKEGGTGMDPQMSQTDGWEGVSSSQCHVEHVLIISVTWLNVDSRFCTVGSGGRFGAAAHAARPQRLATQLQPLLVAR